MFRSLVSQAYRPKATVIQIPYFCNRARRLVVLCYLLRNVVRVCHGVPSDSRDERAEIGAGYAISLPYNSFGLIDTNITEQSIS
jgi:hypothetical protein